MQVGQYVEFEVCHGEKGPKATGVMTSAEPELRPSVLLHVKMIICPCGTSPEGTLIKAVAAPWRKFARLLDIYPHLAYQISPQKWEEMVAAAFDQDGYEEVTLTPRSGDYGRDIIAVKRGVGSVRIIVSVKAYKPGHLVKHDDVRALLGVLHGDRLASKAILSTTSDFAPRIASDPYIAPYTPYRLELMNGTSLVRWLNEIARR
jgi:restriction system protein